MPKRLNWLAASLVATIVTVLGGCEAVESDQTRHDRKILSLIEQARQQMEQADLKLTQATLKALDAKRRLAYLEQAKQLEGKLNAQTLGNRLGGPNRDIKTDETVRRFVDLAALESDARRAETDAARYQAEYNSALSKVQEALKQAATDQTASASIHAIATALQAQGVYDDALARFWQMRPQEQQARDLLWGIERLAARVADNNRLIAQLALRDPAQGASATGDGGGRDVPAPFKVVADERAKLSAKPDGSPAPARPVDARTLDEIANAIKDLDGQIAAKQVTLDEHKKNQAAANAQSDDFMKRASAARGEASLDLFRQAQDAKSKASIEGIKAARIAFDMTELDKDKALLLQRKDLLQKTLSKLEDHTATLTRTWQGEGDTKGDQAVVEDLKKRTQSLIGKPGETPTGGERSIVALAAEVRAKIEDLDQRRAQVKTLLLTAGRKRAAEGDSNLSLIEQARAAAGRANAEVNAEIIKPDNVGSVRVRQWQALQKIGEATRYALIQGRILAALGDVLADETSLLASKDQIVESLTAAKVPVPDDLSKIARTAAEARKEATEAYLTAASALQIAGAGNLLAVDRAEQGKAAEAMRANFSAGADPLGLGAQVSQLFVDYRMAHLLGTASTEGADRLRVAKMQYTMLRTLQNSAGQPIVPAQFLPADLEERPVKPPTAIVAPPPTTTVAPPPTTGPVVPPPATDHPDAAVVQPVLTNIVVSLEKGEVDTAKGLAQLTPEQADLLAAVGEMLAAKARFTQAAEAKFPPATPAEKSDARAAKARIAGEGDSATTLFDGLTYAFTKLPDGWKLSQIQGTTPTKAKAIAAAYTALTDDVIASKYATAEEMNQAVMAKVAEAGNTP